MLRQSRSPEPVSKFQSHRTSLLVCSYPSPLFVVLFVGNRCCKLLLAFGHEARLSLPCRFQNSFVIIEKIPFVAELDVTVAFGTDVLDPDSFCLRHVAVLLLDSPGTSESVID